MPRKKFTPILGDLSRLNPEQQQEYVLAACEHLQIPPELGLVALSWMDSGDGARQLTLYVRRGGTDIIRDRRKIDVDTSEEANGEGYVGWTSKGHDASGRHEIGVGAVSIKGLSGVAVANAVKTSHTQSLRRMTLQFAGGGFLDETEIQEKTTNIASAASSLQQIAEPAVMPNAGAGKDITETVPIFTPAPPMKVGDKVETVMNGKTEVVEVIEAGPTSPAEEPKKRRGRKRKVVSLDSPVMTPIPDHLPEAPEIIHVPTNTPLIPKPDIKADIPVVVPDGTVPPSTDVVKEDIKADIKADVPSDGGTVPTQEQKDGFRKKISELTKELRTHGLLQSEKFGSTGNKLKLFMQAAYPGANLSNLSLEQQDGFLKKVDEKKAQLGGPGLVKFIHDAIGETGHQI